MLPISGMGSLLQQPFAPRCIATIFPGYHFLLLDDKPCLQQLYHPNYVLDLLSLRGGALG